MRGGSHLGGQCGHARLHQGLRVGAAKFEAVGDAVQLFGGHLAGQLVPLPPPAEGGCLCPTAPACVRCLFCPCLYGSGTVLLSTPAIFIACFFPHRRLFTYYPGAQNLAQKLPCPSRSIPLLFFHYHVP